MADEFSVRKWVAENPVPEEKKYAKTEELLQGFLFQACDCKSGLNIREIILLARNAIRDVKDEEIISKVESMTMGSKTSKSSHFDLINDKYHSRTPAFLGF